MTDRAAVPYITGSAVHCRQCRTYQARKVQGPQPPDGGAGPRPCRAGDRRGGDSPRRGGGLGTSLCHTRHHRLSLSLCPCGVSAVGGDAGRACATHGARQSARHVPRA